MEGRDDSLASIRYQDGDTVCCLDCDQNAGERRDYAVGLPGSFSLQIGVVSHDHQVGMKLAQRNDGNLGHAGDRLSKKMAIAFHGFAMVRLSEAEVQLSGGVVGRIGAADATAAGAEPVPEPTFQGFVFEPGPDLEQLDAILETRCFRRGFGELLLRSGVLSGAAQARGDAWRSRTAIAHQSCRRKDFVDPFKIVFSL